MANEEAETKLNDTHQFFMKQIAEIRKIIAGQNKHTAVKIHPFYTLPEAEKEKISRFPLDGFGDQEMIRDMCFGNPDSKQELTRLFERYLDRFELFEPSLITDDRQLQKYLRSFRALTQLMNDNPEEFTAAIDERYPDPAERARFEARKEMLVVFSECCKGTDLKNDTRKANEALERYYENTVAASKPNTGIIEDRWPAADDEDKYASNLHKLMSNPDPDILKRSAERFDHTFCRYYGKEYQDRLKEAQVDLFDLIMIDGHSVNEHFETLYSQRNMNEDEKKQIKKALVTDAVYTGQQIDVAELYRGEDRKLSVSASSLHVNLKELGAVEYKKVSRWRRAFNWLFKVATTARKTADVYAKDRNKEERHDCITDCVVKTIQNRMKAIQEAEKPEKEKQINKDEKREEIKNQIKKDDDALLQKKAKEDHLRILTSTERWENQSYEDKVGHLGILLVQEELPTYEFPFLFANTITETKMMNGRRFALMAAADPSTDLSKLQEDAEKYVYDPEHPDSDAAYALYTSFKHLPGKPEEHKPLPGKPEEYKPLLSKAAVYIRNHGLDADGAYLAMICSDTIKAEFKEEDLDDELRGLAALGEIVKEYKDQFAHLPYNPEKADPAAIKMYRFLNDPHMRNAEGKLSADMIRLLGRTDYPMQGKDGKMVNVSGKEFLKAVMKKTDVHPEADLVEMIDGKQYASELYEKGMAQLQKDFTAAMKASKDMQQEAKQPEVKQPAKEEKKFAVPLLVHPAAA